MRSQHADAFNHDDDAAGYDLDVHNEKDPIRTGYQCALDWVVRQAAIRPEHHVLELGSGTGNLTRLLPRCRSIHCVDVSTEMSRLAQGKLADRSEIEWSDHDVLEAMTENDRRFDVIVSSYTLHHLTDPEKLVLLDTLPERLQPGGRFVVADLMFDVAGARGELLNEMIERGVDEEVVTAIREEFFWTLEEVRRHADKRGWKLRTNRFSQLSWGFVLHSIGARSTAAV